MKSGSHKTPSVSTHKNTPKNQVKAQVQHEYFLLQYSVHDGSETGLESSDPQITFPSFIFACDWYPGTASRAQGYLHISFHPPSHSATSDLL